MLEANSKTRFPILPIFYSENKSSTQREHHFSFTCQLSWPNPDNFEVEFFFANLRQNPTEMIVRFSFIYEIVFFVREKNLFPEKKYVFFPKSVKGGKFSVEIV